MFIKPPIISIEDQGGPILDPLEHIFSGAKDKLDERVRHNTALRRGKQELSSCVSAKQKAPQTKAEDQKQRKRSRAERILQESKQDPTPSDCQDVRRAPETEKRVANVPETLSSEPAKVPLEAPTGAPPSPSIED